ncbi:hypothetical protein BGZ96_003980 [Linnemannia gamsii]|uniref:Ricin B lectin domain-containing protein n=1 Tax=Linnemannia gamsii TaxID=64522 RepID=A0ABQ7JIK5_9FUNG|nr:hypothetical protein BGZ96_003980 [Linnemannia gamsii]
MHLTSALALLSVMAFAVQTGNACTDLCSDALDSAKEGISLDLSVYLNLILKLDYNNVPLCGSRIAECDDNLGTTIDPNTIYTLSAPGLLEKKETCVAPLKCTDSPTGATCECEQVSGPIINPVSKKCLDARILAVGEPVLLYTCDPKSHINWVMTEDRQIRSADAELCLGQRLLPAYTSPQLVLEKCDSKKPELKWTIKNGGGIQNNVGSCIDVWRGIFDEGAGIVLYPCHYQGNQQWTLPGDGAWSCYK